MVRRWTASKLPGLLRVSDSPDLDRAAADQQYHPGDLYRDVHAGFQHVAELSDRADDGLPVHPGQSGGDCRRTIRHV